jgi:hypothetical protein
VALISNKNNRLELSNTSLKNLKELLIKLINDYSYKEKLHKTDKLVCYMITQKERL